MKTAGSFGGEGWTEFRAVRSELAMAGGNYDCDFHWNQPFSHSTHYWVRKLLYAEGHLESYSFCNLGYAVGMAEIMI